MKTTKIQKGYLDKKKWPSWIDDDDDVRDGMMKLLGNTPSLRLLPSNAGYDDDTAVDLTMKHSCDC